jgi:hypothetical protein
MSLMTFYHTSSYDDQPKFLCSSYVNSPCAHTTSYEDQLEISTIFDIRACMKNFSTFTWVSWLFIIWARMMTYLKFLCSSYVNSLCAHTTLYEDLEISTIFDIWAHMKNFSTFTWVSWLFIIRARMMTNPKFLCFHIQPRMLIHRVLIWPCMKTSLRFPLFSTYNLVCRVSPHLHESHDFLFIRARMMSNLKFLCFHIQARMKNCFTFTYDLIC